MKNYFELPDELKRIGYGWELITPEKAEAYLGTMHRNRNLRRNTVNRYKNDFADGDFAICFDSPIIFNQNGEMVNGQHRCRAAVESGGSFWCMVYRNIPNDAVIDKGILRSTTDSLWMRGIIDDDLKKKGYITIINTYMGIKNPKIKKSLSEDQIGPFLKTWKEPISEAYRLSLIGAGHPIGGKAGVQAALFAALVNGIDIGALERMMAIVNSGFYDGKSETAAYVLRRQIQEDLRIEGESQIKWLESITEEAIRDFVNHNPRRQKYKGGRHPLVEKCNANIEGATA